APLSIEVMRSIVTKYLGELVGMLAVKNVTIELTDAARDYLATKGYEPEFGARPLARVIEDELKRPLSEELLYGALEHGG
ncbi:ATP-dependent Clp protease ATP-binding subunit ClpA, partial [Staphylococcus aureus]